MIVGQVQSGGVLQQPGRALSADELLTIGIHARLDADFGERAAVDQPMLDHGPKHSLGELEPLADRQRGRELLSVNAGGA